MMIAAGVVVHLPSWGVVLFALVLVAIGAAGAVLTLGDQWDQLDAERAALEEEKARG